MAGRGRQGEAGSGWALLGKAWQAWLGTAWLGAARLGQAWQNKMRINQHGIEYHQLSALPLR